MEENQMTNDELNQVMEEMEEASEEITLAAPTANETKNEKFMRLAEFRVNKLISAISSLDKLHNRSAYDYSEEQVNMMFDTIEKQIAEARGHFSGSKMQETKFSFSSMMK